LITLFGERLTTQFLSESISLLDNFIFALAPLGILTAAVSAIRVCGNPSLRAFIGRAQEGPGEAEHELLSCVSETTAELFNNGGISRVFGRPRLLEVAVWQGKDPISKEGYREIGTLRHALQQKAWIAKDGDRMLNEKEDFLLPELGIPNLSLNKGIARRSQGWFYCAAALGLVLQIGMFLSNIRPWRHWKLLTSTLGVLAYSALTVLLFPNDFQKDGKRVESYALPLFLIGTISLCTGMFLCAFMIERSSRKFYYYPAKPSKVYWLQPGGQSVGDQVFGSFLGVNEGPHDQPTNDLHYIKSIRDRSLEGNWSILILTISFTLIGFVAQFVGLRGLHASVTLAQMGSTLAMAIIRTCLRTKRISSDENRLAEQEQQLASHKSQELDCFAFHLEDVKSFSLVSSIVRGSSQYQPSLLSVTSGDSGQSIGLGTRLIQTRAQLAKITSGADHIQEMAWDDMPIRQVARNLAQTIGATMDLVSTWQHYPKDVDSFELGFVCQSHHKSIAPKLESYTINLERSEDSLQWRANENELEAVLGLWTWSLLASNSKWLQKGLTRLVGLSESEARAQDTDLYFHKWIYRQREARMVSSKMICLPQCMFGYLLDEFVDNKEILVVKTESGLENMAAQDIYIQFIKGVLGNLKELGGDTDVLPGPQNGYVAHNSHIDDLVSCFESKRLGSKEDALLCIVPVLKHRGLLPRLAGDSEVVKARIEELIASSNWPGSFSVLWWLCERGEGAEFEHSLFALGYLCRRAMLHANPDVQGEGCKYAYRAIEADPRSIRNLKNGRPASWMDANKRPEQWKAISLQLGWMVWHVAQSHSDREAIQRTLESLGICESSVPLAKVNDDEGQGGMGEQAVLQWLTKHEETLFSHRLREIDSHLALDWVCQNNHHALLDWLIVRWTEYDAQCPGFIYNVILWAAEGGYGSAIASLRRHGVDINMQEQSEDGLTPLIRECVLANQKAVRELLQAGADVDGRGAVGETPLMAASHVRDLGLVSLLLQRGANANARSSIGQTPLLWAANGNNIAIVKLLLGQGAKINSANDNGVTALICAASENHIALTRFLISEGADLNMQTHDGCTALMFAARNECTQITKLLLNSGADIHKQMLSGTTALDWARKSYHTECVELLEAAMAEAS
jgi:ankyrin repeat protein